MRKFVLLIPDGASDLQRTDGRSPLADADIPNFDWLATAGVCGLMQTLYADLPRGSIVAQLGMLGWDPRLYSCHGRSVWELLALGDVQLGADDLVFRANLVRMEGRRLVSYNADYILDEEAVALIARINRELRDEHPDFELHHNCDFRNSLVVRRAGIDPDLMVCPEPHEHEGTEFDVSRLIAGRDPASEALASRLNRYLLRIAGILAAERANMIFPWSAGRAFTLPSFRENTGFAGRAGIVGCMDFLHGIAKVGGLEFFKVGNGRPDTDYAAKGAKATELLDAGFSLVICHANSPDEAAHMRDREMKIRCLEAIDRHIVAPVIDYFRARPEELGGVLLAPDHYTNLLIGNTRAEAHSIDPVPFALWNNRDRDGVTAFSEDSVAAGRYGSPVSHLHLLTLLGVTDGLRGSGRELAEECLERVQEREEAGDKLAETREAPIS
ncbi:MAG: 2,3-bisphosphoglycerate-independent phosphoglycerate mutase [Acidobacteriota bacterium]|nr:2,3-bisphosphoglycerate-independent phosphoglycerate mutase [Acidobacteriota bacterium]